MIERHRRCCMSCCILRLFDVLSAVVNIRQNSCAKTSGGNFFLKAQIFTNVLAHFAYLLAAQRLLIAQHKMIIWPTRKILYSAFSQRNIASTGFRLRLLYLWLITLRVCNRSPDMDRQILSVDILKFQPKHLFQTQRMHGLQHKIRSILWIFDSGNPAAQLLHLFHRIRFRTIACIAGDANTAR